MNLKSVFLSSLISYSARTPELFLGKPYEQQITSASPLFQIISGGSIHADFPFSFDIATLPCHILLYTREGCGKLIRDGQVFTLDVCSLLFLNCEDRFRLDIATEPWRYDVLFITGKELSWYSGQPLRGEPAILSLSPYSEIVMRMEKLFSLRESSSPAAAFTISGLLYNIITECISSCLSTSPVPKIPAYLCDIRELFDTNFAESYSLEELARRFHVSKYRLCREFGDAFGVSPMQYLNRRRIHIASHLLLTTDLKIHEVGNQVGISNTNHFITMFKKYMMVTPLEYKQRMTL